MDKTYKDYKFKKTYILNKKVQKKIDNIFKNSKYQNYVITSLVSEYSSDSFGLDVFNFEEANNRKVVVVCPIGVCSSVQIRKKYNLNEEELLFVSIIFDNVLVSVKRSVFLIIAGYNPERYKNKLRLLD